MKKRLFITGGILIIGILLIVGFTLILGSCGVAEAFGGFGGSKQSAARDYAAGTIAEEAEKTEYSMDYLDTEVEEEPMPASPATSVAEDRPEDVTTSAVGETTAVVQSKEQTRKRVYAGYTELLVDNVEKIKMAVTDIAKTSGGYVEYVVEDTITIRVPAVEFSALFEQIQNLGDVLDAYEETVDVTDYFSDLEVRLKIASETRDRLYALLERTEDVKERIKILREIRRLSEEIERINLSFEVLKDHISFSRITVHILSRLDFDTGYREAIPFSWINSLHPLYPAAWRFRGSLKGELPDTFAVFKKDKYYHAETADGIRFRVSTVQNKPRGDSGFWQEALLYHVSPQYAEANPETFGDIPWVVFLSKDREPYYYLVGVQSDGRKLHVLELFFPTEAIFDTDYTIIVEALREIEIR